MQGWGQLQCNDYDFYYNYFLKYINITITITLWKFWSITIMVVNDL